MSARLLLAGLWLFHWLPLPVQAACGSVFGRLGWHLAASRRKIALPAWGSGGAANALAEFFSVAPQVVQ